MLLSVSTNSFSLPSLSLHGVVVIFAGEGSVSCRKAMEAWSNHKINENRVAPRENLAGTQQLAHPLTSLSLSLSLSPSPGGTIKRNFSTFDTLFFLIFLLIFHHSMMKLLFHFFWWWFFRTFESYFLLFLIWHTSHTHTDPIGWCSANGAILALQSS